MLRTKGGGYQAWETPAWLFEALNRVFSFSLDAAASRENAKCKKYYTLSQSGLTNPWSDITFCNPPFNDPGPWLAKAHTEAAKKHRSVMVLPAIGMTAKWYVGHRANTHTTILHPRVAFVGPKKSPNGMTMLMFFGFEFCKGDISFLDVSSLRPKRGRAA